MDNQLEIGEKYLPVGTIVMLKDGKKKLMITGYTAIPVGDVYNKNGKIEDDEPIVFDYCGCFYPEGVISTEISFAFNHDQIAKVYFKGYEDEDYKELNKLIIEKASKAEKILKNEEKTTEVIPSNEN